MPRPRKKPLALGSGLIAYFSVAAMCGLLLAGLALPAVGTAANATDDAISFFNDLPDEFDAGTLAQQSRILYSDGTPMATFYYENRIAVPLKSVSPIMQKAIVAIEDERFFEHAGADPQGILRAFVNNVLGRDTQGASTLTQQWIRNVLLDQARANNDQAEVTALLSPDKGRKVREIRLAIAAEKKYTKEQILQNYLNIALFSNNQYGVEAASQRYFGIPASKLNLVDAALLAGIVQQPTRFNPLTHPAASQKRRDVVLAKMKELGVVTAAQYTAAVKTPIKNQLHPKSAPNGCIVAGSAAFFCDYVSRVFATNPAFGTDAASRLRLLYRGGLTITTTLDKRMMAAAQDTINRKAGAADSPGVGQAITTIQPGTGRILVMAQNRQFAVGKKAGGITTAINYNVDANMGGGGGFQTGSTYKAFTLAAWLEAGHSLTEMVDATKRPYNQARFMDSCGGDFGGIWRPGNSEGGEGGIMPVIAATYNSVNLAYVNMASKLDLCKIRDVAQRAGIHRADGAPLDFRPSTVLGSNELAPMTMANAYATFAASGKECTPIAIDKIVDSSGKALKVPGANCNQAISSDIADRVTAGLSQVWRGTMRGQGTIGRPASGKTGTTNDSTETWFVGFTPDQLSTAVWTGTPDGGQNARKSVNGATVGGRRYGHVFGATISGATWVQYMRQAVEVLPVAPFSDVTRRTDITAPIPKPKPTFTPNPSVSASPSGSPSAQPGQPTTQPGQPTTQPGQGGQPTQPGRGGGQPTQPATPVNPSNKPTQ